LLVVGTVVN